MSKIVIDAREYSSSTGRYISRLLQYLQDVDHRHNYVVLLKPADMARVEFHNPRFTKVSAPYKEFSFAEQLGFAWFLYRQKADLVHFGMTQQPLLYFKKSVTTMHDLTTARFRNPDKNRTLFAIKQWVYRLVIKRVARKSKLVITPSEFVKRDLMEFAGVNAEKIIVTHEAADPIAEKPAPLPALQNKKFIMYVGRPTPHKNLWRLVEAFREVQAEHPALHLALAGKKDANYRRLETQVKQAGIKQIVFTDFVSESQLRWLYEHCAAYVFPSLSEGFGLPGLEAMMHGAPLISSEATCLPEIYGQAAYYFDPLDVADMAAAITTVLTDKVLQQELIAAAKKQAQKYSWHKLAEQTLAIYSQVLNK